MTTTYVQIGSIQEFQDRMELLGRDGAEMVQKAMHDALNGTVRIEIFKRVPVATNSRYNHKWSKDGKDLGPKKKGAKSTGAVNQLKNSLGPGPQLKGTDEIIIGATAPYAGYVHEAKKPVEGHYWKAGQKGGWSRPGSGNKFISGPLERHADDIPEWAIKGIDKRMKDEGIF